MEKDEERELEEEGESEDEENERERVEKEDVKKVRKIARAGTFFFNTFYNR